MPTQGENRKAVKSAKLEKAVNSFEVITREWYTKYSATWNSSHGERILRRFERDIFPWIGSKPIAEIAAPELLATLRRIESQGSIGNSTPRIG